MIRFTLVLLSVLLLASSVGAEVQVEVRYGHGGRTVAGAVTPIVVRLTSRSESEPLFVTLSLQASSGSFRGERCTSFGTLAPRAQKDFRFYLRPTANTEPQLKLSFDRAVMLRDQNKTRTGPTSSFRISPSISWRNSANSSPAAIQLLAVGEFAGRLPRDYDGLEIMPVLEAELPDVWHGYDGLDTVYLRNPFEEGPADAVRLRALLRWVELGGTLVVSATHRPDLVRASPLDEALPANLGSPVPQGVSYRDLGHSLAKGRVDRGNLPAVGPFIALAPREAAALVTRGRISGQQRVVSVSRPYGLGWVSVLAFDPARYEGAEAPLSPAVLVRVLGIPRDPTDSASTLERAFMAIDEFPVLSAELDYPAGLLRVLKMGSVKAPPILLLSLFMLLYVVAIGPIDYFFLKHKGWLKYSALSFVILALLFSGTAWFVSFYLFAGSSRVNRVTFVDVVPDPGESGRDLVAIHDFAGYYEPRGGTLDLEVEAETCVISQLGTIQEYLQQTGSAMVADALEVNAIDPARARATLSVPFRSLRTARLLAFREELVPLKVEIQDDRQVLIVTNDLPYRLRDAVLVTPRGTIPLGDLAAGSKREFPAKPSPQVISLPDAQRLRADPDHTQAISVDDLGPLFHSLGRYINPNPVATGLERILDKSAFTRSYASARRKSMLIAWTNARDPFRLPGGEEDGFRVTVIRRILER